MTETDYDTFAESLRLVMDAFPKFHLAPPKVKAMTRIYFDVLKTHSLADVLAAGKRCIETHKSFPVVADWLDALPPVVTAPADVRQMWANEVEDHARARQLCYEDEPCLCAECEYAGVMHRPLRFVPTEHGDGFEKAFNTQSGLVELVGHWAHGEELRRWYAARDHFFALKAKSPLRAMLASVGAVREPGEEG